MARRKKRRGPGYRPPERSAVPDLPDPLDEVVEYGGELIWVAGCTPGGAPFGPRVEIVDGELRFPDPEPFPLDGEPY